MTTEVELRLSNALRCMLSEFGSGNNARTVNVIEAATKALGQFDRQNKPQKQTVKQTDGLVGETGVDAEAKDLLICTKYWHIPTPGQSIDGKTFGLLVRLVLNVRRDQLLVAQRKNGFGDWINMGVEEQKRLIVDIKGNPIFVAGNGLPEGSDLLDYEMSNDLPNWLDELEQVRVATPFKVIRRSVDGTHIEFSIPIEDPKVVKKAVAAALLIAKLERSQVVVDTAPLVLMYIRQHDNPQGLQDVWLHRLQKLAGLMLGANQVDAVASDEVASSHDELRQRE